MVRGSHAHTRQNGRARARAFGLDAHPRGLRIVGVMLCGTVFGKSTGAHGSSLAIVEKMATRCTVTSENMGQTKHSPKPFAIPLRFVGHAHPRNICAHTHTALGIGTCTATSSRGLAAVRFQIW